jgi:hypothetical protein
LEESRFSSFEKRCADLIELLELVMNCKLTEPSVEAALVNLQKMDEGDEPWVETKHAGKRVWRRKRPSAK